MDNVVMSSTTAFEKATSFGEEICELRLRCVLDHHRAGRLAVCDQMWPPHKQ